jgi:3-oxoacyl-[acyl-carrier protein] reductase
MDMGITGKVAVVAGGSRGCGRGIAEALAREGAHVLLTGREPQAVKATVAAIRAFGGVAHRFVAHMADKEGAISSIAEAR